MRRFRNFIRLQRRMQSSFFSLARIIIKSLADRYKKVQRIFTVVVVTVAGSLTLYKILVVWLSFFMWWGNAQLYRRREKILECCRNHRALRGRDWKKGSFHGRLFAVVLMTLSYKSVGVMWRKPNKCADTPTFFKPLFWRVLTQGHLQAGGHPSGKTPCGLCADSATYYLP